MGDGTTVLFSSTWVPLPGTVLQHVPHGRDESALQSRVRHLLHDRPSAHELGAPDRPEHRGAIRTAIDEYLKHDRASTHRFEQFRRFLLAGDPIYTMEAAQRFDRLTCPTLIVWATEDRFLSASWARRLYDDIAGARRIELIPFAGHFVQEVKPELVAKYIDVHMHAT